MINRNEEHEPNMLDLMDEGLAEFRHFAPHLKEKREQEEKEKRVRELIDWFVVIAMSIVDNAWSEAQAIERSWNITVNFVREYKELIK